MPEPAKAAIEADSIWSLRLSAIVDDSRKDPCAPPVDERRLCVRVASTGRRECLDQVDACRHGAISRQGIAVLASDLTRDLDVTIVDPRRGETHLRLSSSYPALTRIGLCNGFQRTLPSKSGYERFTYFLVPR